MTASLWSATIFFYHLDEEGPRKSSLSPSPSLSHKAAAIISKTRRFLLSCVTDPVLEVAVHQQRAHEVFIVYFVVLVFEKKKRTWKINIIETQFPESPICCWL